MKPRSAPSQSHETPPPASHRVLFEGAVIAVLSERAVLVRTSDGREVPCRRSASIDMAWLTAALEVAPVEAEGTLDTSTGEGSLWCVFPGAEHADVRVARLDLVASDAISLRCGKSTIALGKDGLLEIRARDIASRGTRSNRLSGGTVRIN